MIMHLIQSWDAGKGERPACGAKCNNHRAKTWSATADQTPDEHGIPHWGEGAAICVDCARMKFRLYSMTCNATADNVPGRLLDHWKAEMGRRFGATFVHVVYSRG